MINHKDINDESGSINSTHIQVWSYLVVSNVENSSECFAPGTINSNLSVCLGLVNTQIQANAPTFLALPRSTKQTATHCESNLLGIDLNLTIFFTLAELSWPYCFLEIEDSFYSSETNKKYA